MSRRDDEFNDRTSPEVAAIFDYTIPPQPLETRIPVATCDPDDRETILYLREMTWLLRERIGELEDQAAALCEQNAILADMVEFPVRINDAPIDYAHPIGSIGPLPSERRADR